MSPISDVVRHQSIRLAIWSLALFFAGFDISDHICWNMVTRS